MILVQLKKLRLIDKVAATISIGLLIQLFVSLKLWLAYGREFPEVAVFGNLNLDWPNLIGLFLFILLCKGLILTTVLRNKTPGILIFFTALIPLVFQDVIRLQAWVYLYSLFFICLLFVKESREKDRIFLLQIILISTYFWSGFHKINIHFSETIFPWLLEAFSFTESIGKQAGFAYGLAAFEMLIGLGLCFKITRKVAIGLAIIFHLGVLVFLGPLGHNWNSVVWAWNVVMPLLVFFLFYKQAPIFDKQIIQALWKKPLAYILVIGMFILPLLFAFGKGEYNLSSTMYSGLSPELYLMYHESDEAACFPNWLEKDDVGKGYKMVQIDNWATKELKVPVYPNATIFKRLGQHFCDCFQHEKNTYLLIYRVKRFEKEGKMTEFSCND